jgi:tetratricopeptide (TPR) repeat protein
MSLRTLPALVLLLLVSILPARSQVTLAELSTLYQQGQLDDVIARGTQALKATDEQPIINLLVGRAYTDKQQFQTAIPFLRKSAAAASSSADVKAWSQAYLGTCSYALQDYRQAQRAFETVVAAQATRNVTAYATKRLGMLRAQEVATMWSTVETAHFRFHFQAPARIGSTQAYAAAHEQAYEAINTFFQAVLPRKIEYYVWDDRLSARQLLGRDIGFTQAEFMTIHALKDQTKGHEITHLLLEYGLHPRGQSRLINEGIAVYFDQTARNRLVAARQAVGGNSAVDVWKMWEQPQGYSEDQLYAVGGALLDYLAAHASEAELKRLLQEQTPQLGHQLFSQQVAAFEQEVRKPNTGSDTP